MSCERCPGKNYHKLKRSPTGASLVILSDVPSVSECRRGEVTQNQQIIFGTLEKVGIPKEEVYLTTALKCAYPKKKNKQIPKEVLNTCRSSLIEEVQATGAKWVIPLGATATKVLMGNHGLKIKEVQGLVAEIKELSEVQIIPSNHPATMLRAPGEYKPFLRTFQYVSDLYHGRSETLDPGVTEYKIIRTEADVIRATSFLSKYPLLGCDIETTELSPFYSEKQGRRGESLVIGIAYQKNKVLGFTKEAIPYMQRIFNLPNKFVWHGGKFDKLFERAADGIHVRIDHDLMLVDYALNETSGTHDLEQISMRVIGADSYKDEANKWIRSKAGFESAPEELQLKRVCMDADYTLQAFIKLYAQLKDSKDLRQLYHERLIPAANAYPMMEYNGLRVDLDEMKKLEAKYDRQIEEVLEKIEIETEQLWDPTRYKLDTGAKTASLTFKPTSPKQVSWLIFDVLKLRPRIRKKRSTSKEVLESIPNPPRIVELMLELRTVKKEYGTYVEGFLKRMDENHRVHSNFSLHITATGRRSSSGPNIQNIPSRRRDIRRAFVPGPGRVLMEVDYAAAESRVLAIVSNDKNYLQIFKEKRDPHGELAEALYGKGYTKNQRMRAKAVNFGVPYGRQAHSIAEEHEMSHSEAQGLIDAWAAKYPEAWSYLEYCGGLALQGKAIRSPMGRYKRPGLITPESLDAVQNEYKNFTIQSTVADFTLLSVVKLQEVLDENEAFLVNEVHDSVLLEVKDNPETIRKVGEQVVEIMSSIPKDYLGWELPFLSDIEVGNNWADMYDLADYLERRD